MSESESVELRLDEEFAAPSAADWRAAAERELKGRSLDTLTWRADAGFALPPLSTAETIADLPHLRANAAGLFARHGAWSVRSRIDFGIPTVAGEAAARAVAHGADELELALDVYARNGDEPELQDLEDEILAGDLGLSAYCARDLEHVFDAIDLRRVPISFDAGRAAVPVLAAMLVHADEQGIGRSALRAELGIDVIGATEPGESDSPSHARRIDIAARVTAFCRDRCAGIRPLVLDGRPFDDGSATEELAGVMATGIAMARALGERGIDIDALATVTCLRLPVTTGLLVQIAKLRAARLLWAKIAKAFGATQPSSLRLPLIAHSSERDLAHEFDLRTNLLRTTVQAFAATVGGCDSLVLAPYELDPDHRGTNALRLARAQQHLLREEARLGQVADPAAGSYALERATHEIAERAWKLIVEIESAGGILASGGSDLLAARAHAVHDARLDRHRRRVDTRVGISRYVDPDLEEPRPAIEVDRDELHRARCSSLERDDNRAKSAIEALDRASQDDGTDLVGAAVAATADGATFLQIEDALFGAQEPPAANMVTNDRDFLFDTFEEQRLGESSRNRTAMIIGLGEPRARRAASAFAVDLFRSGGFTTVDPDGFATTDAALERIAADRPAIIVVCCEDTAQAETVAALATGLTKVEPRPEIVVAARPQPSTDQRGVIFIAEGYDVLCALEYLSLRATLKEIETVPDEEWITEVSRDLRDELQRLETVLQREAAGA